MLTDATATVDGVWLPVSELARRKGISKQAISKRVARFQDQGLLSTKTGERGAVLVNLIDFDRVAGETTDFAREQGGRWPDPAMTAPDSSAVSYTKSQAEEKRYKAEMARLDLEERLRKVLPVAEVEAAMVRAAEIIVRIIDRLPTRTDDPATRTILRKFANELRVEIAASMSALFDEGSADERQSRYDHAEEEDET